MKIKRKIILLLAILLPLIALDRWTKVQAMAHLRGQDALSFWGGFFTLTYHENSGAMLSLGNQLPDALRFFIFTGAVGIALLAGIIYLLVKPIEKINYILGLIVIAGGLGNLYDRAFYDGKVVDFMLVSIGALHTGVFNIADVAIMTGFFGLIIHSFTANNK